MKNMILLKKQESKIITHTQSLITLIKGGQIYG